jgi:hypothetical protein
MLSLLMVKQYVLIMDGVVLTQIITVMKPIVENLYHAEEKLTTAFMIIMIGIGVLVNQMIFVVQIVTVKIQMGIGGMTRVCIRK